MQPHSEYATQGSQVHSPAQPLLRPEVVAQQLNVSMRTLEAWRYRGGGPKFIRISARCIRYRLGDLVEWQQLHERANTIVAGGLS